MNWAAVCRTILISYFLIDLGEMDDAGIESSGHLALSVVLGVFKHIFDDDYRKAVSISIEKSIASDDRSIFKELISWMFRYVFHAKNENIDEFEDFIEKEVRRFGDEDIRRTVMNLAAQYRQKGVEEGIKKGLEEGKLKTAGILLKQLKRCFGDVSPLLEQKLRTSGLDLLDRFGESIFNFKTLEDAEKWWEDYGNSSRA